MIFVYNFKFSNINVYSTNINKFKIWKKFVSKTFNDNLIFKLNDFSLQNELKKNLGDAINNNVLRNVIETNP